MRRHGKIARRAGLAALALLLVEVPPALAQERQVLEDASARSTVVSRTVLHLSFAELAVGPDVQAHVFRLPGEEWGVSSAVNAGVIQRFDAAGAPAGTFRPFDPNQVSEGDVFATFMRGELWLVDARNARLVIYTKDLSLAGTRKLRLRADFVSPARDSTSLLVSGSAYADSTYYAVTRISRDQREDAFGVPLGRDPLPASQWLIQRRVTVETAGGEIWAVAISGGAIDVLRSSDLTVVRRLKLPGSEMAQEAPWLLGDLDKRPAPRLWGVTVDTSGLLWLCFGVADRAWTPGVDPRQNIERYFDTRMLAIDPVKQEIVGTAQLDAVCVSLERNLISCADSADRTIGVVALTIKHSPADAR